MKLFFDIKFTGLHQKTTPISIGIVSETGETLYKEFRDFDISQVDAWQFEYIFPHTVNFKNLKQWSLFSFLDNMVYAELNNECCLRDQFLELFRDFLSKVYNAYPSRPKPEFYKPEFQFVGDCGAYNWVLLNELWGGAINRPFRISSTYFDICTMFEIKGIDPDISRKSFSSRQDLNKHNALDNALLIKTCYERLIKM